MGGSSDVGARLVGGRYRLLERLGQGGMGTVWKAYDDVLSRTVAVKEVDLPQLHDDDRAQLRERTMREARAAARLSHPNAVTVYDVVEEDGQPWIIMQLVAADSLADALRDRGPLPPARVAEIGLAVLDALQAAHAAGILHRDVKPGNVLLGHDGRVVLTDFGIATLEGDPSLTSTGLILGAPAYIAPERARGLQPGPASDLWSLGATLYTALEGRPPYERDTPLATLTALMTEDPPPPGSAGPLAPLLEGLLEHDPRRRLDAGGARGLLERALDGETGRPGDTSTQPGRPPVAAPVEVPDRTQAIPRPGPPDLPDPPARPQPAPGRPVPTRPPGRRGRLRPLLVALLSLGLLAALAGTLLVAPWRHPGHPGRPATAPAAPAPTPSAKGPSPSPSRPGPSPSAAASTPSSAATGGTGGTGATGIPAGYRTYTDPTGFSVAVPIGWKRVNEQGSPADGQFDLQDPGDPGRKLRFGYTTHPKNDPVADWQQQERRLRAREPGYQRISIQAVDYRGWPTADWDFRIGDTRVKDRGFKAGPSHGYAIYLSAPVSQWEQSRTYLEVAARTFQPPP
jgi:serine/threonine protein kinase